MWLRKAHARCELWSTSAECDVFEGWHDGYRRLSDPVMHRRRIVLEKTLRRITIIDRLEMLRTHDIELNFHCSERCIVERRGSGYLAKQGSRVVTLTLPHVAGGASSLYFGNLMPIAGWVSRRFDEKMPAPTIRWRARVTGPCVLRTRIDCP